MRSRAQTIAIILSKYKKKIGARRSTFAATSKQPRTQTLTLYRQGELDPDGGYFTTPGASTYYDPDNPNMKPFRFKGRIADTDDVHVAQAIISEALRDPQLHPDHQKQLLELQADPHITYMENDRLPLPAAAKRLGYDAIRVWENDDMDRPTSVFVWNTATVNTSSRKKRGG